MYNGRKPWGQTRWHTSEERIFYNAFGERAKFLTSHSRRRRENVGAGDDSLYYDSTPRGQLGHDGFDVAPRENGKLRDGWNEESENVGFRW